MDNSAYGVKGEKLTTCARKQRNMFVY